MGHPSTPSFRTLHALRIKGFATVATLAEMTALDATDVEAHLAELAASGHSQFREARALWQLTPDGRAMYPEQLAADIDGIDPRSMLAGPYAQFLECNDQFKMLCGDWQLRDGEVNDHGDSVHDGAVLQRLVALHERAHPIAVDIAEQFDRFGPYPERLASVLARLLNGETNMFTGVMCGSYHDAWMELHEDLILTQGIDRTAEGSF